MNILVTGASGFLGTALCRELEKAGHTLMRLNSKNCDLTKKESLYGVKHLRYDQIYHLAAWTEAGDFCLHHAGEQWVINQPINTHVLEWWQKEQPQAKMICMGTSCSYSPELPLQEKYYLMGEPIESLFTYAMTKRMLYVGLKALQQQYGLKYLCVVPSTLYGPGYHTDGRQMHFIFDLIRKILRGKKYGEPVVLWGHGHQKRELVFIDDFVQILLLLSDRCENELINIGAGTEYSIREFAQIICKQVGFDFQSIQFDHSKYVGAESKCLDVSKLQSLLPNIPLTLLATGLSRTIEWMEQHLSR